MHRTYDEAAAKIGAEAANENVIDHLANRLAEALIRSGMGERHVPTPDEYREKVRAWDRDNVLGGEENFYAAAEASGPLLEIAKRINNQRGILMRVTAHLNMHADRVSGHQPEPDNRRDTDGALAKGMPAIQAIFIALDQLDEAIVQADYAANRNTTLA